jgi:NAD(P)-dependent dehydrogenase (short-subunit alcohol dehydrogenase family)
MTDLRDRRVLITGASSGVGAAAAERFARAGCDVALLARSVEGLERAAEGVRAAGRRAVVVPADVVDRPGLGAAIDEAVDALGGLDVLVVNAAAPVFGPFTEVDAEDFDKVIDVTFTGAVNTTRLALPALERDGGGTIVVMGSLNSRVPLPAWSAYCAAKHAERGFFNTLAIELEAQDRPVKVAQLHPGAINTPIWENAATPTGHLPRRPPEGYPPEQIADALVTLAARPRREVLFGSEALGLDGLWNLARPVGDRVMRIVFHYFMTGKRPAQSEPDALREAVGRGIAQDGLFQRPSVTSIARGLAGAAPFRLPEALRR